MKKLMQSVMLGLVFAMGSIAAFAGCAQVITIGAGQGPGAETCILVREYTINGVQFCEYDCSPQV